MPSFESNQLSGADLDEWVNHGLITSDQAAAIRHHLAEHGAVAGRGGSAPRRGGLNLLTIAAYFGAFLLVLAYTLYVGLQWEQLSYLVRAVIAAVTIAVFCMAGELLRRNQYITAGNLLIFAGVGVVPLLVHTLFGAAQIWPEEPAYGEFYRRVVLPQWIAMELAGIAAALVAVWVTRFPLITLHIAVWTWFLSMDLARWAFGSTGWMWDDRERLVGAVAGVAMLGAGVVLQWRTVRDYSLWLYLAGHVALLINLGTLALDRGQDIYGLTFLAIHVGFVAASVWLQRRIVLVFGALGCFIYVTYLALSVFEGALGFVVAVGVIGLLLLLGTVAYQRFGGGTLAARHVKQ